MQILIATTVIILSPLLAYYDGFRRGRDRGWLDHYFAGIAREMARRDKRGRFRRVSPAKP